MTRQTHNQAVGDRSTPSSSRSATPETDPLFLIIRSHSNFTENVPVAFILAASVELNGGNKTYLNLVLANFFIMRIVHVEFGLLAKGKGGLGWGRTAGGLTTLGTLAILAGWNAWLCREGLEV